MGTESALWHDQTCLWPDVKRLCHLVEPIRPGVAHSAARKENVANHPSIIANALASDLGQSISKPGTDQLFTVWQQRQSQARIWALGVACLVLGSAYAPNFRDLSSTWTDDPNYSHGFLVIPIAVVILWRRLSDTPAEPTSTVVPAPWWGWVFLTAFLALRALAYERNSQWAETATLVPVIACLTWTFGSWPLLSRAWPAIAFLVFMLPLPPPVNDSISLPLQRFAAIGSCFLLQLSGLWAVREGNVINLSTPHGMEPLDVALACSGLRMLMTLAATVTATIILFPLATWKRIVLLVSAVPIALLSNMIRIVATGLCYYFFAGEWAKQTAHDWSGYLMMLVGMGLVWLELKILSWLVPDEEPDDDEEKPISPLLTRQGFSKDKSTNQDLGEI
jgi:exosortase